MLKLIGILLTGILTSFYFFPIEFTFLPGLNTKMAMAGCSLVLLGMQLAKGQRGNINKDMFRLSAIAVVVSLIGVVAVSYNGTPDYTYCTYIVSMWVWMGGAYVVANLIKAVHGRITLELVCNYLIAVCVAQCISALMIDKNPAFKAFVDTYVSGFGFVEISILDQGKRLYGIGAGVDVSGLRFSAVLVSIAHITTWMGNAAQKKYIGLYLLAFVIIGLVGNMMARTTTMGIGLALAYWAMGWWAKQEEEKANNRYLWTWLVGILLVSLPVIVWQYHIDEHFRQNLRFGFEGFFSLAEKGRWDVNSNNILKNMVVFPDNLKTWLIGDGYFNNPVGLDPHYIGENFKGYYMQTDIGYLRFIFYFGIFGLLTFIYFFIACTRTCIEKFPTHKWLFLFVLAANLIGWCKVSTDIFPIIALFLCVSAMSESSRSENEVADANEGC